MSSTPTSAALTGEPSAAPAPTAEQQQVLDRIAAQRVRLRARRHAMAQSRALAAQRESGGIDESLALRAAGFAREHPLAVAAIAGIGLMAGPRRLIRWAGVVLPLLLRMRR